MAIVRTDTSIALAIDNLPIIAVNQIVPPGGWALLETVGNWTRADGGIWKLENEE